MRGIAARIVPQSPEDRTIQHIEDRPGSPGSQPDLLLFFAPGHKPDGDVLARAAERIKGLHLSPVAATDHGEAPEGWVQLERGGLTFDCTGLAPGPDLPVPDRTRWVGTAPRQPHGASIGLGLGPHVRAGQAVLPVLKGLLALAADLVSALEHCQGVCWLGSGVAMDRDSFVAQTRRWLMDGPLPIALLVATDGDGDGVVATTGLAYFTGQEIRVAPGAASDPVEAARLAGRVANQLIYHGPLEQAQEVTGVDGLTLRLEPGGEGALVDLRPA